MVGLVEGYALCDIAAEVIAKFYIKVIPVEIAAKDPDIGLGAVPVCGGAFAVIHMGQPHDHLMGL